MSAIDSMNPVKGFALGFLLAAVPRICCLTVCRTDHRIFAAQPRPRLSRHHDLHRARRLHRSDPRIGYLVAPTRMIGPLETLRESLVDDTAADHGDFIASDRRFDDRPRHRRLPSWAETAGRRAGFI